MQTWWNWTPWKCTLRILISGRRFIWERIPSCKTWLHCWTTSHWMTALCRTFLRGLRMLMASRSTIRSGYCWTIMLITCSVWGVIVCGDNTLRLSQDRRRRLNCRLSRCLLTLGRTFKRSSKGIRSRYSNFSKIGWRCVKRKNLNSVNFSRVCFSRSRSTLDLIEF